MEKTETPEQVTQEWLERINAILADDKAMAKTGVDAAERNYATIGALRRLAEQMTEVQVQYKQHRLPHTSCDR